MEERDLEEVLSWRNHPDVRRYMYFQDEITLENHRKWFSSTKQDANRHLLIFETDLVPMGFANLAVQKQHGLVADWGFYVAPGTEKGTGTYLGKCVLEFAFCDLELHKVCGEILTFNSKSIRFHKKLGFVHEGTLRQHHFDGVEYQDIECMGLLRHEWQRFKGTPHE
ncbi:UDP-4-amino-4,6-dideoxy-N-acetyl-beta-L-altrosamine N-acetyltransferase [Saccharospirillum salsuginis]|uniref:UDP-4-amino-4, 6-dideoxy-N-acetyl-beta-L-altrosamine N-acetyltransferase n=1 Tax=Saccharospirillum salsuginis TaxID=418750 RepID=UPI001678B896|nr:UDP-4-amino-4,6-dideoxy-N-acetyl-beta-L-altrosamine N-acetyltransferase [Saccharospirillum salsuginis]